MKTKLFFLFFIILFVSCSPQQRLTRLLKKYPELVKTDTIILKDTIVTEPKKEDFVFSSKTDTVTITKDKIKLVYRNLHDTIKIGVEVQPDTVYYEKNIQVEKVNKITEEKGFSILDKIIFLFALLLVIVFLLFLLR